jgi:nucleoside-diphosphate-sugar epimerase
VLVVGCSGQVGRHLVKALDEVPCRGTIIGADRVANKPFNKVEYLYETLDVRDL